jgi:uncharacterized protein (TIGR03382 family)
MVGGGFRVLHGAGVVKGGIRAMRISQGVVRVIVAAALLRAGVAAACPTPPEECPDASELVVKLNPPAVEVLTPLHEFLVTVAPVQGHGSWCDSMVLFTLDSLSVRLPGANGGPDVQLSDVRISRVEVLTTKQSAARYGSAAFCLWAAEEGRSWNQRYELTVVARDPQGNAHRGAVTVEVACGAVSGTVLPTVDPKTCDPRCIAEVPPPPPPVVDCNQCAPPPVDCSQCTPPPVDCSQCSGNICCGPASECPEGSYCPDAAGSRTSTAADAKLGSGGCAAVPGTGSWGMALTMLGAGLARRRRG